ncbi:hypothetical protein [Halovivax limisalsi]|uniref:hypothetical protein n=1 Tax=Halovivax limisalsi TaxID=1453760 RepID=UPI001FFD7CB7|nr:hypothetical protein [Halovivax limisalsi]
MSDHSASTRSLPGRLVRQSWRDLKSIYYANTVVWRLLKSVGLLMFGFFCWSASSLLLSYRPSWTFLYYTMAYGFVLICWGPLTHIVVVPLVIRLRRTADHPVTRWFARHGSKVNLSTFVAIVVVLATIQFSPMLLDFQSAFEDDSGADVAADLRCETGEELVTCQLTDAEGVDRIVVATGGTELETIDDPAATFEIRKDELEEVVGQKQYTVRLYDADGNRVGVFRRSVV